MIIGIPKEILTNENRVSITPGVATKLLKLGYDIQIEKSAGEAANFTDDQFEQLGVKIVKESSKLWKSSDIIVKINKPTPEENKNLKANKTLISLFSPGQNKEQLNSLARDNINVIAMDSVPRISRAQKLDTLSSMANIAGSRAVIEASHCFSRFFGGQITAAGKIPPAKVLVIGAGVAGLSAIGTASSLGAIVRAFDTRKEVKDQVESLNAEFLTIDIEEDGSGTGGYAKTMSKEYIKAEYELFEKQCQEIDIIITTALVPGKPAPKLITKKMVELMKPGSVIVDLAAEQGGNCELTKKNKKIEINGINIIGYTDLPSRLPTQASQLYATNMQHLFDDMTPKKDGELNFNMDDEVVRAMTVIREGKIIWPPPEIKKDVKVKSSDTVKKVDVSIKEVDKPKKSNTMIGFILSMLALIGLGSVAPASFMAHFTVFVLACFVGYMVVWNVTSALHTPLMSVTNAVSSIIIIGALIQISSDNLILTVMASLAIFITSINIFGGFAVTKRMLDMFKK
ncbi:MAG: Re/Si-specific NAD(P)(+) transhydrogenase subunit alpha [Pseudomonadota bacterium]|nr:Re/Si-specific NAD(P)(+) transhydrogenase subunit alpha [Pseudomonadota bacterium]